jgi:hypothetical protein
MLQGMVIDNMVIGGPAFDSGLMRFLYLVHPISSKRWLM